MREALRDRASALEEGKADVLGLFMVTQLHERRALEGEDLRNNYVTFVASIFRSVRFGASSAHGRANIARFNFFRRLGAVTRDSTTQTYRVDFDRIRMAVDSLSATILRFQGDGDYAGVTAFMEQFGTIDTELQGDLDRLRSAGIPVDVVYEQGMAVLQP